MIAEDLAGWFARLTDPPLAPGAPQPEPQQSLLLSVSRPAMACEFEVLLNQKQYADGPERAVSALDLVEHIERLLSVYKPRSDLSNLNRFGAERAVGISPDTATLLELAKFMFAWTKGAFDITAGSLSEVWGFSRRAGRKPSESEVEQALARVGTGYLQIDPQARNCLPSQAGGGGESRWYWQRLCTRLRCQATAAGGHA